MKDYLQQRRRVVLLLAPAAFGLLYLILCLVNLQQSIWFDESFSAYLIRFDFGKIWELTAADVHPPFYYFLLKIWSGIFGYGDFALRSMSAIFGALAILFAFLWLKYKYGLTVATVAGFLMSICPVFVRYGQEMRMYTLVMAIVFAATYVLQLAIDNGKKKWWIIYAILVSLGMWTHYFCAFAWIAHVVYLFIIYKKKIFSKKIIGTYALAVILFIPWMPSLLYQVGNVEGNGFWIGDMSANTFANYLSETLAYSTANGLTNWAFVLTSLAVIVITVLSVKYYKKMLFLLCLALVPVIALTLLSMPPLSSMFIPRYILFAMTAIYLIGGVSLTLYWREIGSMRAKKKAEIKTRNQRIFLLICCGIILVAMPVYGLYSLYTIGNYNFSNGTKSASKELFNNIITMDASENLPIISESVWLYYDISFYSSDSHPVYFIDETTSYDYGSLEPLRATSLNSSYGKISDLDDFLDDKDAFWYVGPVSENTELSFPREGWHITMESVEKLNDYSDKYQIYKLERDDV